MLESIHVPRGPSMYATDCVHASSVNNIMFKNKMGYT